MISLQRYTKALSSQQRTTLVEKSRQKPQDRMRVVTDVGLLTSVEMLQLLVSSLATDMQFTTCNLQAVKSNRYDDDPIFSSCGIKIDSQLTRVEGRVLSAPMVRPNLFYILLFPYT